MENITLYSEKILELVKSFAPTLVIALLTLIVGSWIIKIISKILDSSFGKMNIDETLKPYLVGIFSITLKSILYITVIGMLGVQTTSFIAILGAAGLAIGMALRGSLSNFAGGVLILIFKPIKKGDFIEAQGISGTVESIQPFVTVLLSPNNLVHYLPNAAISNGNITNYSIHQERRVDLTFGIGYNDDIDKAKELFMKIAKECPNRHEHLEPTVFMKELADSSVNFGVRLFCTPKDYWGVYTYMLETVKKEMDKANLSIPFPQRDLHVYNK